MTEATSLNRMLAQVGELDKLRAAMERSAEHARFEVKAQLKKLSSLCAAYWSGNEQRAEAFELVNREAHLAAFLMLTYSETVQVLRIVCDDVCETITAAGHAMQLKAFSHEEMHLVNELSPTALFYDELYSLQMFEHKHARAYLGFDLLTAEDVAVTSASVDLSKDNVTTQTMGMHHD